jgi:hypothetical protein
MFTFTSIVLEVVEMAEEKETTNSSEMDSPHKTQVMVDHTDKSTVHHEMDHLAHYAGEGHKTKGLGKPMEPHKTHRGRHIGHVTEDFKKKDS